MVINLSVQLVGVKECIAALKALPDAVQRKYLRIALNAAGGIIKRDTESRIPRRTGLLRRSIAVKVKQGKNGEWYTAIGAKRGMAVAMRTTRTGRAIAMSKRATSNLNFTPGGGRQTRIKASRYLHLLEKGTKPHTVSVKNARVLAGNGRVYGTRVTISAKPRNILAISAAVSGHAAQWKAITKLREAILSHSKT